MRLFPWILSSLLASAGSCTLDLEGAPCPCADASVYECCAATNLCIVRGSFCPSQGGSSGGTPQSGGTSASGGVNAAGGSNSFGGAASGGRDSNNGGDAHGGNVTSPAGGQAGLGGALASGGTAQGGTTINERGGNGSGAGAPSDGGSDAGAGGAAILEAPFVEVATQHNDNARTGANLSETTLTASSVKATTFGELSRRPVRGAVFAQPLLEPEVTFSDGHTADVLYVATMANDVYALDASAPERPPFWVRSLGPSVTLPDSHIDSYAALVWHEVGIWGTPVLSKAAGALYVVTAVKDHDVYRHRVHKLSASSGAVLASVTIEQDGFDSSVQAQTSALTLAGGVLYVPFGGYGANTGVPGWLFAFDTDLAPRGVMKLGSPNGNGVSMNGQGLAVSDDNALYFTTNPSADSNKQLLSGDTSRVLEARSVPPSPIAERVIAAAAPSGSGNELGGSGVLLMPNSNRLLVAGQQHIHVFNRQATDLAGSLVQEFRANGSAACLLPSVGCATPTAPVLWPGAEAGSSRLFVWSQSDLLRSFRFDTATGSFDCPSAGTPCTSLAASATQDSDDLQGHSLAVSAQLSLSANAAQPGTGIVWAAHPFTTDPERHPDGMLRAFDAANLRLLWSTESTELPLGPIAPTTTPTVSGGRVFVGNADGVSNKQTFWDDWAIAAPGIAGFDDRFLVLAWSFTTTTNRGFQLAWSTDGFHFTLGSLYDTFLYSEPALAADDRSHIFLAYTTNSQFVKVVVSSQPDFVDKNLMLLRSEGGVTSAFELTATSGPALVYGGGKLFAAWNNESVVHVISSSDGVAFDESTHFTIPNQFSYWAPALAYANDKLYLVSTGTDRKMSLYVSSDGGAHFDGPTALPCASGGHPALLSSNPENSGASDLQILWADPPSDSATTEGRIKTITAPHADFLSLGRIHEFVPDGADGSISAARFRGAWYFSWKGVNGQTHPNVARYSTGELISYGLGGR